MKRLLLAALAAATMLTGAAHAEPVDPVLVEQRGKAFIYVALLRHEAECPMARSAAFKAARSAMLLKAVQEAAGVPISVIMWQHAQLDQLRATPGPVCRLITQLITDQQLYQQRLTSE
jgi:hypothetical protein